MRYSRRHLRGHGDVRAAHTGRARTRGQLGRATGQRDRGRGPDREQEGGQVAPLGEIEVGDAVAEQQHREGAKGRAIRRDRGVRLEGGLGAPRLAELRRSETREHGHPARREENRVGPHAAVGDAVRVGTAQRGVEGHEHGDRLARAERPAVGEHVGQARSGEALQHEHRRTERPAREVEKRDDMVAPRPVERLRLDEDARLGRVGKRHLERHGLPCLVGRDREEDLRPLPGPDQADEAVADQHVTLHRPRLRGPRAVAQRDSSTVERRAGGSGWGGRERS
jgi:hypothetical protein